MQTLGFHNILYVILQIIEILKSALQLRIIQNPMDLLSDVLFICVCIGI